MQLTPYQAIEATSLKHSGHSYEDLAHKYGTPLYIFDEALFRETALGYKKALTSTHFATEILYASKAVLTVAIAKLIAAYGIGQDVVSAGEIYTGLMGGVDPAKMYFHGNNKLDSELQFALDKGVGTIVIDNRMEAARLSSIAQTIGVTQRVLLRLNPGVEAHTHDYIKTATLDSKFGESVFDSEIFDIISAINAYPALDLVGFHCHIGSQIFDQASFLKAADEMLDFAGKVQSRLGLIIREINFGGGFGVYYTEGDTPFSVVEFLPVFVNHVYESATTNGLKLEKVTIEPGRSLVNPSGSTLYRVGDIKHTAGGKSYAFVDGGMTDNIRPALYQAEYEAMLVNRATAEPKRHYTIAGKACESGDIVIRDIALPEVMTGDLLLVNGTGAYNYSMSSNYNHIPRPAMVHIDGDKEYMAVRRQTFDDLISTNLI